MTLMIQVISKQKIRKLRNFRIKVLMILKINKRKFNRRSNERKSKRRKTSGFKVYRRLMRMIRPESSE